MAAETPGAAGLDGLRFDNSFTRALPADPEPTNTRRQVLGACFSRVKPLPAPQPVLVACAAEVAALLDLAPDVCRSPAFLEVFAGNRLLPGMDPYAACYGGHQFGHWAGQLGDGRAINLGEIINRHDERWTLQLKGAGPTPYSRGADGFAVLRSSIREFLCSEAMHHLGVPTTRALSVVTTGAQVMRDMFYDGRPALEPGAVVCRVAPSFTRFGSFEIFAARGEHEVLQQLADYTLRTDFPALGPPGRDAYVAWLAEIARRTARLMVEWLRVGFVHGVMNTDNMSVLGLTIDYGPYGWLDDYDPDWTPNTTDAQGRRYRYGQQPQIALWNLVQLANALYPLVGEAAPLEAALGEFSREFDRAWGEMMAAKLGLARYDPADDAPLVGELLALLTQAETDMTIFYRRLAAIDLDARGDATTVPAELEDAYYAPSALTADQRARTVRWLADYAARVAHDGLAPAERRARMARANPKYVLRNYLAQQAIDRAHEGDYGPVRELLELVRRPYDEQPAFEHYAAKRPDWARDRAGCSMLSCSS